MQKVSDKAELVRDQAGRFTTTHWSVVVAAAEAPTRQSAEALESLCSTYWYPLFAFLRRAGHGPEDAQDLTQSFFLHLLEKNRLSTVSPAKGKFRSFLIASLKNFMANEWDKRQTIKRGAQFTFFPLDFSAGEARYGREPSHDLTPDRIFERSWGLGLLENVLGNLRAEFVRDDKGPLFEQLQPYLSGERGGVPYATMASRLNLTEAAMKMAVLRLRRRFGELLRAEIAQTVCQPEEIDEEIRCLFAAVSA